MYQEIQDMKVRPFDLRIDWIAPSFDGIKVHIEEPENLEPHFTNPDEDHNPDEE